MAGRRLLESEDNTDLDLVPCEAAFSLYAQKLMGLVFKENLPRSVQMRDQEL